MDVRSCNCNGWVRLVRVTKLRSCEPEPRPAGVSLFLRVTLFVVVVVVVFISHIFFSYFTQI